MARPKLEVLETAEKTEPVAERFVLKKSHGLIVRGKASRHFAAGTEFDPSKDGELVSQLAQSGAIFE